MKVNPNRDILRTAQASSEAKSALRGNDAVKPEFASSADLTQKLAATPDVRADEVARAKALIADPNYPDAKTVRAIARRLTDKVQVDSDDKP